jgi:hypothetical protein
MVKPLVLPVPHVHHALAHIQPTPRARIFQKTVRQMVSPLSKARAARSPALKPPARHRLHKSIIQSRGSNAPALNLCAMQTRLAFPAIIHYRPSQYIKPSPII